VSWERKPLEEVADFCLGKMLDQNKNKGEALPYLANVNVRWGEFDFENLREMRFEPGELDRYGLKYGDIVMCEGGEPGRCAIWKDQIPGMMIQKALHRIRPHDCLDSTFLFYNFLKKRKNDEFSGLFTGSTIKHLPREKLAKVQVDVPPIFMQQRIAEILSSYDDLIENNQRRIALLEEAARMLYREWFVRFRFPGHEHVKIIDGLPERWERRNVCEFGEVITGKTPSTKDADNYGGEIPFIKTPDMHGNIFIIETESYISEKGAKSQSGKLVPAKSLMVSCIGTIGVVSITTHEAQFNQQINALVPLESSYVVYLFFALRSLKAEMEAIGGGATMANVNKSKFEKLKVIKPSVFLLRQFHEICAPVFQQIEILSMQNVKLRGARDLLLPRLMNGEIAV
jgi:type I restriction enzyme, S subunit